MDQKVEHLVGNQSRMYHCLIEANYPAGTPGPFLQSLEYPNKP